MGLTRPVETACLGFDSAEEWRKEWARFTIPSKELIPDPNNGVLGMNLPRSTWLALNRPKTENGRCGAIQHKWRFQDNPDCDCENG